MSFFHRRGTAIVIDEDKNEKDEELELSSEEDEVEGILLFPGV